MSLSRCALILAIPALLFLWSCSDEGDPAAPADPGGTDAVSFVDDVQPIFDSRCTECHGAGGNGGLDLRSPQSHGNLVNTDSPTYAAKRVVPGDVDASVLFDKITGGGRFGSRMPPIGSALTAGQIATIRAWISEGARPD